MIEDEHVHASLLFRKPQTVKQLPAASLPKREYLSLAVYSILYETVIYLIGYM